VGIKEDLQAEVKKIFAEQWDTRDGTVVPESQNLKLGNDAVKLDGTVLYADMSDSTRLVDTQPNTYAAEIYKAYLYCAAKLIRAEGGAITAYDGDRVMAVFIGDYKNTSAVRAALKMNWARTNIINPALKAQYPNRDYVVKHSVGIDTSKLFVARTGIRGSNDLVWVGRSANYAAKLATLPDSHPTWITEAVYKKLDKAAKEDNGTSMWEARSWTAMNKMTIYRSEWAWVL